MNFILLITLALWIFLGLLAGSIAARRGRSRLGWTLFGLLLGPAAFLVSLLTPRPGTKCPYCAEIIRKEAVVCRFCGHALVEEPTDEVAIDPAKWQELFHGWLTERQLEVEKLTETDIEMYRAAFEKDLQDAMQAAAAG